MEFDVISAPDLDFYKEMAKLKLNLLFEESRLGMYGLVAQTRVTSK